MITKSNLKNMLLSIGYNSDDKKNIYIKNIRILIVKSS